jgi:thiosulfate/3-mercaptopyruvate sulfurtransferase
MTNWDGRGLVSTEWLAANLGDAALRLYDVTVHLRPATPGPYNVESGRADYEAGHIPGAAFLDLVQDLSDTSSALHFTRPSLAALERALGAAGIGTGMRVVAYSSASPMWATRFWWMLRAAGIANVAVLDGGLAKWAAEGREVVAGVSSYGPAQIHGAEHAESWADKQDVLSAIGDGGVCTINALSPSVHSGEAPMSYGRKGHIRGSANVPYAALLAADGTFRPDAELRPLFEAVGAFARKRVICYCGGGISATMDALALTRLGHDAVAVYDGSMAEWTADPDLPMDLGA